MPFLKIFNIFNKKFFLAIFIGTIGGAIFASFNFPLAWMMGSMLTVTIFALIGAKVEVDNKIRAIFISILGVMLGSAFTPNLIEQAGEFGIAFMIQLIYMIISGLSAYIIYRSIPKYDKVTSYFSSTPGGLSEMTIVGEQYGGDSRIISLNHSVRILIIVTLIPFYFRIIEGVNVPLSVPQSSFNLTIVDAAILVCCVIFGYPIASKLKIPAAALVGPMILSAGVHITGITNSLVPTIFIATAQVFVGTSLGCRFTNRLELRKMAKTILIAIIVAITMIVIAIIIILITKSFLPFSSKILFLSIAPGGLAEMSIIALALGTGTAFVTVMHFLRVSIVMLFGALIYKIIFGNNSQKY
ncbi:AbrB family transcriptional regulator [Alphaproteobacteria bacterium]|nr:AbrB family transcriptional regulator [Alphaproteobacteria bacterium]